MPESVVPGVQYDAIVASMSAVIQEYLSEARGAEVDDFTADTPFMDAGLDSLDMLKVSNSNRQYFESCLLTACHLL